MLTDVVIKVFYLDTCSGLQMIDKAFGVGKLGQLLLASIKPVDPYTDSGVDIRRGLVRPGIEAFAGTTAATTTGELAATSTRRYARVLGFVEV